MPHPTAIKARSRARLLEVTFDDGARFELPFEYLRVYSPSAEVRGHGPGQETLQLGKHDVGVRAVEPVGNYAVRSSSTTGMTPACTRGPTCTSSAATATRNGSNISRGCRSWGLPTRRRQRNRCRSGCSPTTASSRAKARPTSPTYKVESRSA